jgi:hypothetical protein
VLPAVAVVELHDRVAQAGDGAGDMHAVLVLPRGPLRRAETEGSGEGRGGRRSEKMGRRASRRAARARDRAFVWGDASAGTSGDGDDRAPHLTTASSKPGRAPPEMSSARVPLVGGGPVIIARAGGEGPGARSWCICLSPNARVRRGVRTEIESPQGSSRDSGESVEASEENRKMGLFPRKVGRGLSSGGDAVDEPKIFE